MRTTFLLFLFVVTLLAFMGAPGASGAGTGEIEWIRQFGTSSWDGASGIAVDAEGLYVVGSTTGALPGQTTNGAWHAFLAKYDRQGSVLWTRQFGTTSGSVYGRAVATDASGIYVVGTTLGVLPGQTSAGGPRDAFVRKYDHEGNELWTRQFGTYSSDYAWAVATDASGVYVGGQTYGAFPGHEDWGGPGFVRKYDHEGQVLWTDQLGSSPGTDPEYHVVEGIASNGSNVYLAVRGAGGMSSLRKYDREGNPLWSRQIDTASLFAVSLDATGVYIGGGHGDAFLRKYDHEGNELWTRQFGTAASDIVWGLTSDATGIYAAGNTGGTLPGQFTGSEQGFDSFVRKYDHEGNELWTRQFGNDETTDARAIASDATQVYTAGTTDGALAGETSFGSTDAFVAKLTGGAKDGTPPPERKVLFIQGIHSESGCPDGFADRIAWMNNYLASNGLVAARVDLQFPPAYFSYSDEYCAGNPIMPDYEKSDTCGREAGFDDYRIRLKELIEEVTSDGSKVTLIGHSMGGLIAANLVGILGQSNPEWVTEHIASVVTFDSPLRGLPSQNLALLVEGGPCEPTDNSIAALSNAPENSSVAAAHGACGYVPFYTIDARPDPDEDAVPGTLEAVPGDSAHFADLSLPGCVLRLDSLEPAFTPGEHTAVWGNPSAGKENFLACAILVRYSCDSQQQTILPGENVSYLADVADDQTAFRADLAYPGSLVTMTLYPPESSVPIDPDDPNIVHEAGQGFERYDIPDPQPGEWMIELFGADVPELGEPTTVMWDTVPQPLPDDADEDGCTNAKELGPVPAFGGLRDPLYFWDFFDVYTGDPPVRDRAVTAGDIGGVVARFGTFRVPLPSKPPSAAKKEVLRLEALTPPMDLTSYHAAYDRNGSDPAANPWNLLPPDGSISAGDIGAVVAQFGHTCA